MGVGGTYGERREELYVWKTALGVKYHIRTPCCLSRDHSLLPTALLPMVGR